MGVCKSSPNILIWCAARGRFSPRLGAPITRTRIWCTSDFATYSHDGGYERMTAMRTTALVNGKESNADPAERPAVVGVAIDGLMHAAQPGERLVDLINRVGLKLSQVCYHPQLGPIQTCDTCLVEIDGQLVRACATTVADGMSVSTVSSKAHAARQEAFDRILSNHMLYCTVCDNNNGNCTVHNTTKLLAIEHQQIRSEERRVGKEC